MNSRLCVLGQTTHIWGGGGCEFDAFLICVCVLGDFLKGEFGILEGEFPQEIAGINTGQGQYLVESDLAYMPPCPYLFEPPY